MKYKTTESKPMSWYNDFTFTVEGRYISPYEIEKVIVNDPAVIVLWCDKTKTVVKCQNNDNWDVEKAIAMCFVKKALGNKGNYYNHIRDALSKCEGEEDCEDSTERKPKEGEWAVKPGRKNEFRCSKCGKIIYADCSSERNYCPNCGSKNKVNYLLKWEDMPLKGVAE